MAQPSMCSSCQKHCDSVYTGKTKYNYKTCDDCRKERL